MPSTLRYGASKRALKAFGLELKKAREGKGLTQEDVAERLKVSAQSVSNWERGTYEPQARHSEGLAALYGVDIDDLRRSVIVRVDGSWVSDRRAAYNTNGTPEEGGTRVILLEISAGQCTAGLAESIKVPEAATVAVAAVLELSQRTSRSRKKKPPVPEIKWEGAAQPAPSQERPTDEPSKPHRKGDAPNA